MAENLRTLLYKTHVENEGWGKWVQEGRLSGTTGKGLRIEAIRIQGVNGYRVHVENIGWMPWVKEDEIAGTVGEGKRIEAIEIKCADLNYQVHVQDVGWLDFARNGEQAGTTGGGLRIEAIRMFRSAEPIVVDDARSSFAIAPKPIPIPDPTPINPPVAKKSGKIYFAVGHGISSNGTWDCGCVDGPYTEADLMLPIGKVVVRELRNYGFDVNSDADTENNMNIAACVAEANRWGADAYISIHCDYNLATSGLLPIIYPGSNGGMNIAQNIVATVSAATGLKLKNLLQRDDWEVSDPYAPACIFETGSIRYDVGRLLDAETYGKAVAQGIYNAM